jgi:hypothetical protein
VPVLDSALRRALKQNLLDVQLADTVRASELGPDGVYRPIPRNGDPPFDAQLTWTSGVLSLMHG